VGQRVGGTGPQDGEPEASDARAAEDQNEEGLFYPMRLDRQNLSRLFVVIVIAVMIILCAKFGLYATMFIIPAGCVAYLGWYLIRAP